MRRDVFVLLADNKALYIKLWLAVFIYIISIGLLIQLFLLPIVFPSLHAGDGLLVGGDWLGYQALALELVHVIEAEGWSAWQLRPSEQAAAGIAAAIYTITGITKPWVMLPLNAAVHATSAVLLLLIIGIITKWEKPSLWPVLPFIFFPTALLWNAQFHKDSFFILGSYLFLFGMLLLIKISDHKLPQRLAGGFNSMLLGIFLIWVVRPYGVEMVFYIGLVLALMATLYLLYHTSKNRKLLFNILIIWLALFAAFPLTGKGSHHQFVVIDYDEFAEQKVVEPPLETAPASTNGDLLESDQAEQQPIANVLPAGPDAWQPSTFLPAFVDENLYKMAVIRERYLLHKPEAGSNIDLNVSFSSALDLIRYIPRAFQIGLLAPFPATWFALVENTASSLMRQANALEMLIVYLSLVALLLSVRLWYKNPEQYLTFGFTLGMILSYALVVANVGTLNRMRYGFLMTLVALGIAFLLEQLKQRREQNRASR